MFAEVGLPLLAAMFLNISAFIIAVMILMFFVHEATAMWDVIYATTARTVTPIEQHVHSFLEMIPLMAIVSVISLPLGAVPSVVWRGDGIPANQTQLEISTAAGSLYLINHDRDRAFRTSALAVQVASSRNVSSLAAKT
jgi:hypothetical protein